MVILSSLGFNVVAVTKPKKLLAPRVSGIESIKSWLCERASTFAFPSMLKRGVCMFSKPAKYVCVTPFENEDIGE